MSYSYPKYLIVVIFCLACLLLSSAVLAAEIKLAWDAPTNADGTPVTDLAGYEIYYGTSARIGTDPKSCGLCGYSSNVSVGNVTTYTITNLTAGQNYFFSVVAVDFSNNESVFSNQISGVAPGLTYTISGYVRTSGGVGISGVVMSGLPGSPSTAGDGSYTGSVNYGLTGTVNPTKAGYTFSPSSTPYSNVISNQSQNYTGTVQTYTISGYVRTSGGVGISGVVMSGLPGSPSTAGDGSYTGSVNYGWTGTATPTKAGYTFSPSSTPYSNVISNQSQNYTGTVQTYTISGYVRTSGGVGISGVVMSGLPGSPSTAGDGSYTGSVNYGWTGTATPTKAGYTFSPSSIPYSNVISNQSQNYTGTVQTYTISGYVGTSGGVGISGVVMSGLPGSPSTAADGSYTGSVNYGWTGTATPTKAGYTFSPSSTPYSNVISNQSQNYTGTVQTLTVLLKAGYNLVSFPTLVGETPIAEFLSPISGKYEAVYAYEGFDPGDPWKIYDPALPPITNDLQYVDSAMGLWIEANQDTELTVEGLFPSALSIPLCVGWNLISYAGEQAKPVAEALSSISGKYEKLYTYRANDITDPWKKYDVSVPSYVNDLVTMEPGLGYWIYIKEICTLVVTN